MNYLCRNCGNTLGVQDVVIDLGHQPPSNSLLTEDQLYEPETYYPLRVYLCQKCFLVQIPETKASKEIFNSAYPYYSSESPANVSHAKEYVEMMAKKFKIKGPGKRVLEIGSNDGYLLQWFKGSECNVLGIDPAGGPVEKAKEKGIPTIKGFFRKGYVREYDQPFDLICSINTIAHQPDIHDFVGGMRIALAPRGIITAEFPHLLELLKKVQFDTIYHEHYSYFSFKVIKDIFFKNGLSIFRVEKLPEHGGSLRIFAAHNNSCPWIEASVDDLVREEAKCGLDSSFSPYSRLSWKRDKIIDHFADFLVNIPCDYSLCAYGAAAKASTFFNCCGKLVTRRISFVVDRSPHKQGKFLPGSHLRITDEDTLKKAEPEYVLITAWNLKDEIMKQLSYIRKWGGKFVVAIPKLEVL